LTVALSISPLPAVEVRKARLTDMPRIEALLREMLDASQLGVELLDEHRSRRHLAHFLVTPDTLFLVLVVNGRIEGMFIGNLIPVWWMFADAAQDIVFYVAEPYRGHGMRLLREFRKWAKGFDSVKLIQLNVSFGGPEGERTEKLFTRMGLTRVGAQFIEEV
jgi:GNAT superfamily N-acetyltransferase